MNGTKLGILTLSLLFSVAILVPVLVADIASADCGACVSDCGGWSNCAYDGDLLQCGGCSTGDCDRGVRDCDHCVTEYRCSLSGCSWIQ